MIKQLIADNDNVGIKLKLDDGETKILKIEMWALTENDEIVPLIADGKKLAIGTKHKNFLGYVNRYW